LDYSPDGKLFATAGKNARILIYRSDTNSLYLEIEATDEETDDVIKAGHHQRVFALKFHPQHKDIFVTGGWDRAIKVTPSITPSISSSNAAISGLGLANGWNSGIHTWPIHMW
jgi:WD40 repeat protein